jgi:hypothetical protein
MEEWTEVFEQHTDDLFRFLIYMVGNRQDAEDLAQETFIKGYRSWNLFDGREPLAEQELPDEVLDQSERRHSFGKIKKFNCPFFEKLGIM